MIYHLSLRFSHPSFLRVQNDGNDGECLRFGMTEMKDGASGFRMSFYDDGTQDNVFYLVTEPRSDRH
ncbi:MAG: hypothetical protein ABJG41_00535 [Cyclobacteriaceae bacterium]